MERKGRWKMMTDGEEDSGMGGWMMEEKWILG